MIVTNTIRPTYTLTFLRTQTHTHTQIVVLMDRRRAKEIVEHIVENQLSNLIKSRRLLWVLDG